MEPSGRQTIYRSTPEALYAHRQTLRCSLLPALMHICLTQVVSHRVNVARHAGDVLLTARGYQRKKS